MKTHRETCTHAHTHKYTHTHTRETICVIIYYSSFKINLSIVKQFNTTEIFELKRSYVPLKLKTTTFQNINQSPALQSGGSGSEATGRSPQASASGLE